MSQFRQLRILFPMTTPKSDIFTITEVAAYLKVAERTLYRLAAAKKIPAFKVWFTWRFPSFELEQWIKCHTAKVLGDDESVSTGGNA